jgi:hypothetical protein
MKKPQTYSYIKGSKRRGFFGGYESLWLAEDHLLLLRSSGWADRWRESSRRFYFHDIQGLIFCEDKKRRNTCLAMLCPALIFLIMALLFRESGYLFHIPIALIFLVLSMIQWFKGPTCITQIQTAVQSTRLPCVRLRAAEKLKKQLQPLIEETQGCFENQHLTALQERSKKIAVKEPLSAPPSKSAIGSQTNSKQTLPKFRNSMHLLAFLFLLSQSVTAILTLLSGGVSLFYLDIILTLISLSFLVMALYRQSRSQLQSNLTWLTWLGMATLVLFLLMNFGLLIEVFTNLSGVDAMPDNEYEMWRLIADVNPADSTFLRLLLRAKIVTYGIISVIGLILSFKAGRSKDMNNG